MELSDRSDSEPYHSDELVQLAPPLSLGNLWPVLEVGGLLMVLSCALAGVVNFEISTVKNRG